MRMFVAIDLDDRIKAGLPSVAAYAKPRREGGSLKFVDPQRAHLTLVFLGEIASPQSDRIIAVMQQPIADVHPFHMTFGGLGVFPPRGAPRVLWLGVSEGEREVIALQRVVARRLQALGIEPEDRPFQPHLTLGRWRQSRPSDRPSLAAAAQNASTAGMTVDRVTLFESRLSSKGPAHMALAHTPLQ
jgi:RNA 2',3'-cyclic 3'-phosphodiesterase